MSTTIWTQEQAIALCVQLEVIAKSYGAHVGLTGGCLYKIGDRKDCDILIYRIRDKTINFPGLLAAFTAAGITIRHDFGFCIKARYGERPIDFLYPESQVDSDYPEPWAAP